MTSDTTIKTDPPTKKLTAREAVQAAEKFYMEVTGGQSAGTLEEVENRDDGYWYITLGFPAGSIIPMQRLYRVLKVDETDGTVVSMKLR